MKLPTTSSSSRPTLAHSVGNARCSRWCSRSSSSVRAPGRSAGALDPLTRPSNVGGGAGQLSVGIGRCALSSRSLRAWRLHQVHGPARRADDAHPRHDRPGATRCCTAADVLTAAGGSKCATVCCSSVILFGAQYSSSAVLRRSVWWYTACWGGCWSSCPAGPPPGPAGRAGGLAGAHPP